MTAKYDPAKAERLIAEARKRYAATAVVGTADALDMADQLEALKREHDHWSSQTDKWRDEYAREYAEAKRLREELETVTVARNADRTEWMTTYATMRAGIEALRCGDLVPFVDGELSAERHAAFQLHLGTCADCQRDLEGHMQLERTVAELAAEREPRSR